MTVDTEQGGLLASIQTRYPQGYAVVDVETSGLSPSSHRVLQVAISQVAPDGTTERNWSTLLDPGCDPGPVHVHGLTRQRLAGSPQFVDVAAQVSELVGGRILVAHNAQFDWRFLAAEARRSNAPLAVDSRLCTMALTRLLDLPLPNLKLESVAAYWGVRQLAAHDAVDDTRVLVEVLRHSLASADRLGLALPLSPCDGPPPTVYPATSTRIPCRWAYPGRWTPPGPLVQGMKVVFTGATRLPRETLAARATSAGLDVMNSASSKTSVVVCPDPSYRTRKLDTARSHGTPIVSEEQFLRLVADVAPGRDKTTSAASVEPRAASTVPSAPSGLPASVLTPPGRLAGRRVLVLGGPHPEAAAVRTRIAMAGGQVAVNFTASVTDVVVLDGGEADPRWHRGQTAGLSVLDPVTLDHVTVLMPGPAGTATVLGDGTPRTVSAPLETSPVVMPRGAVMDLPPCVEWSLSVRWADGGEATAEVDVVAFVTDDEEEVGDDGDFVFFNAPTHHSAAVELQLDLASEVLVSVRPDCLPPRTRRVILAAAIPDGLTFSDVGPIELTLRDEDGATVAHATLDAATEEQSLVLAVVYQRGDAWRFRVVGQGYACGLGALAVRHGVDVDE